MSLENYQISLVLATKDRDIELMNFLDHLQAQSYTNYELIIVDQNTDDRVKNIVDKKPHLNILYFHSAPGLSKARNVGLKHASGEIIGFPDDDCWYDKNVLKKVNDFFGTHPEFEALAGKSTGETGGNLWKWDKQSGKIDKINVWKRANSNSIFTRFETIKKGISFNEKLGVGSGTSWGSGEEIDFLLQILKKGGQIFYDPSFIVFHENSFPKGDNLAIKKAYSYASGMGYVLRINDYSMFVKLEYLARPFLNTIYSVLIGDIYLARFKWAMFRGRVHGMLSK